MKLSHTALVRAPRARVWKLITDLPTAARCVPGVAAVTPSPGGGYKGSLLVQLGPVRLVLDGDVALTATDETAGKATVRADAKDSRLGGTVRATMDLALIDKGADTELRITSDVQIAGIWVSIDQREHFADMMSKNNNDIRALTGYLTDTTAQIKAGTQKA